MRGLCLRELLHLRTHASSSSRGTDIGVRAGTPSAACKVAAMASMTSKSDSLGFQRAVFISTRHTGARPGVEGARAEVSPRNAVDSSR